MMKLIVTLFTFLAVSNSLAYQDERFLKGGIAGSWTKIGNTIDDRTEALFGIGVSSAFGYKTENYEFSITSNVQFGKLDEDVPFKAGDNSFVASGRHETLTISPVIKSITEFEPVRSWRFYYGAGPVWTLQSVNLSEFDIPAASESTEKVKLTYESFGWQLLFGIEEQLPYKEMHPVFFEVALIKTDSYKASLVDKTDFKEIEIITVERAQDDIDTHTVFVNMGMTIF